MLKALKRSVSLLVVLVAVCSATAAADWNRGVSCYKKGDYQAALAEFQQIAIRQPDSAGAWYYVGLCEFRLKEYKQVELPLSHAIQLLEIQTPGSADLAGAWYTIGFSHYLLGEYDKAIDPLKKYAELIAKSGKPPDPNARRALGRSYYFVGRFDDAAAILAETSATSNGPAAPATSDSDKNSDKDSASAQAAADLKESAADAFYLGAIYFKQGDYDKAIAVLQASVKDRSDDVAPVELLTQALMKKASASRSKADWSAAADSAEQLSKLPDDLASAAILGRAYFGAQEFDKAVPPLEKVARANPSDGDAWVYYGIALSRSGQTRKAMEALEITIRLVPNSMPALAELAYIYESSKQYDQALRVYEKAYEATGSTDANIKASIDRVKSLAAAQH